ncbi:cytochrome-c oxidase, cbb3-type subunit II [Thalassospira sp. MA62]|nr:cytochrome-c oxidase, cbb3-type subunit II [Thalassospira sp. MA62]
MLLKKHHFVEKNVFVLILGIFLTVIIGGIVEIVPLFTMEQTIEKVDGVRPYSPLEQAGRNIYIREGCYNCHSQQIRPFRDEVERYGHYSLAAESMYDHPFQWGSKRTGPDLARVGGKYSNAWHVAHLVDPRSVVPESIMPGYPFLAERELDFNDAPAHLETLRMVGVPYTDEMIEASLDDLAIQATEDAAYDDDFLARYPNAATGDFDGDPEKLTEMDALIAYLQVLGRMVDFTTYNPQMNLR